MPKNADKLGAAMGRSARSAGKEFASSFAEKLVVETVRLAIDLDKDFHRSLETAAAERSFSRRDLVIEAVQKAHPELRGRGRTEPLRILYRSV